MEEIHLPLLNKDSPEGKAAYFNIMAEEEELNLPFTMGDCVTYRYLPQSHKFNFQENMDLSKDLIRGKFSESEFLKDLEVIGERGNFNPPSFWVKFLAALVFITTVLIIGIVLLVVWAMLILDLVFLALAIYLIRKSVILCWVWKMQYVEKSHFSKLEKVLRRMNEKYNAQELNWKLDEYKKWLQLGKTKTEHNILTNQ